MELQAIKAEGLRKLARTFRERAAEAGPGMYRDLMIQTASELEEYAAEMEKAGPSETVLVEVDKDGEDTL